MCVKYGSRDHDMHVCVVQHFPDLIQKKERFADGLAEARDEYWKLSRRILSPTFSSFKLKAVSEIAIITCGIFLHSIFIDGSSDSKQCRNTR